MPNTICTIDGCTKKAKGRGWCSAHYERWRRNGDPLNARLWTKSPEESFASRTEWRGDCIVWTGALTSVGYGHLYANGEMVLAHRYAWERENGPIPEGLFIDHICFNPACVNVPHLRLATNKENVRSRSGAPCNSTTGIRNVRRHGAGWGVYIGVDNRNCYFGTHPTLEEAIDVAEAKRQELFGEFAGRG